MFISFVNLYKQAESWISNASGKTKLILNNINDMNEKIYGAVPI